MKNKKTILAVVAMVLVIGLMVGVYLFTRPATVQGGKEITVEVVHGDGSSKTFTFSTDAEFLGQVLEAEELVEFEEGPYGMMIKAVDGEQAVYEVDGAYWALFEGEDYAMQGADLTVIEDGDLFKLVYTIA